ncbi:dihydroorotase [Babesia ovata]|uniref:dihydroorotase n=1 Tax=Babesia ovata TaxID=189622 RepID=A0A2H6K6C6_9APIC|nr:dihydroorotase [Babesia ovata]GBE58544.1 dihydroorotase [Babesia ovata]
MAHVSQSLEEFYPIFSVMEELGLSLHVHGEQPGSSPLSAEAEFIPHIEHVARSFPRLKVVAEHVSTKASLDAVSRIPNLAASVTPHHLFLTTDDVLSGLDGVTLDNIASHIKNPHLYCKPLAKSADDRDALLQAIKSRSSKVFLGSDSAPHPLAAKSSANPPAGIFTQPFLMNYVATIFKQLDRLDFLEDFACRNGATFLGLPPKELNFFEIDDETFAVPPTVDDILVPFLSGHQLLKIIS